MVGMARRVNNNGFLCVLILEKIKIVKDNKAIKTGIIKNPAPFKYK